MDWVEFLFTIVILILLTFILYAAAGIASGDWNITASLWFRFLIVAAVAAFIIPALQSAAGYLQVGDLALLIAFIVILFMIKLLITTELVVADEWMNAIFISLLTVLIVYIIQKIIFDIFDIEMFSFIPKRT